jgi:plastocyanin
VPTIVVGLAVVTAGCSREPDPAATILVDYSDEFATQFIRYFPDRVQVHPGDTIEFQQTWTGEPHTVTFGTSVDEVLAITRPLIEQYAHLPEDEIPPEVFEEYFAAEAMLPVFFEDLEPLLEPDPDNPNTTGEIRLGDLNQTIAQPCLIEDGEVPDDGRACERRDLPPFRGTEVYYNSGIIPFEGTQGNTFRVELDEDIAPGEYGFYCAVHGTFQAGTIEVLPPDQPVPPPTEVSARTRDEVNEVIAPFQQVWNQAQEEGQFVLAGEAYEAPFSGFVHEQVDGLLNEFVPGVIETRVGEPVTWRMFGPHSISFDVPEYFPIVEFQEDGSVKANEAVWPPAGGAPPIPEQDPTEPLIIDGGTYDGEGFWSSGVLWSDAYVEYTVRFSQPGTYRYACLIHPPMVGDVRVTD